MSSRDDASSTEDTIQRFIAAAPPIAPVEARVLAVHAARPGFTARGFARSGSYDRVAACVPVGARALDLACGDGALLDRIPNAIGLDVSRAELAIAGDRPVVCGRAQALPFPDQAFDAVTCHLAFTLLDDIDAVAREIDRVLAPGGSFIALTGGGPLAEPAADDAFPIFLELLWQHDYSEFVIGAPRSRNDWGWALLFPGWDLPEWERCELVLDGDFAQVWSFLAASYELPADPQPLRAALAKRLPASGIRCRAVTWLARATKR